MISSILLSVGVFYFLYQNGYFYHLFCAKYLAHALLNTYLGFRTKSFTDLYPGQPQRQLILA